MSKSLLILFLSTTFLKIQKNISMKNNILLFLILSCLIHPVLAEEQGQMSFNSSSMPSTKILGGIESKQGDWPWIVALLRARVADMYSAQYCSGSLIDDTWVLTAAHCVEGQTASAIEVAVGVFDLEHFSGNRTSVESIYMHPEYNKASHKNDIALLELKQASSQPIITLFSGESKEEAPPSMLGRMLTAIGWGMADGRGIWYWPEKLRQVNLPVRADSDCNNIYPIPASPLSSSQICAGYYEGKDVCNGDSGGPVVSQIDGDWVHIGLVSFGAPCDDYWGWYGVYTRTSAFVDFITRHVPHAQFTSQQNSTLTWLQLLLN
jgi:secreted trypsin-like serine protease